MAGRNGIRVVPLKTKDKETPEFAGDYLLDKVVLMNHLGFKIDIKFIMLELNIYESIFNNAVTGTVVIGDTKNQIARMEIQGLERIAFHLKTPGRTTRKEDVVDASFETGEPFHVYKVTDRKQINSGLTTFKLHFASREFMRNLRTKVSQSYDGKCDSTVADIMKDKDYLDSRKKLHIEPTGNSLKFVIPNLNPFDAINMIANKSVPENSRGVGYFFYETTGGFYFRSWQNMITRQGNFARIPKQDFYYQPQKLDSVQTTFGKDGKEQDKVLRGFQSVEAYQFVNNFHDVATNTALGTYGHRVISHNLFDKSYDVSDYNYHRQFNKTPHTDSMAGTKPQYAVTDTEVDYDNAKNLSDFKESRVSLQTVAPFLHDKDVGRYGLDVVADGEKTGQKISQYNQIAHGTVLKLTVQGQSQLQAGDLIRFNLKDVNSDDSNQTNPNDPRFSGNYIITKIRHTVTGEYYKMILECAKDSVGTPYRESSRGQSLHGSIHETKQSFTKEDIDFIEPQGST